MLGSQKLRLLLLASLTFKLACANGVKPISSREPILYERAEGVGKMPSAAPRENAVKTKEMFVKKRSVHILPSAKRFDSGSLYNLESSENQLFVTLQEPQVGDLIEVKVINHRSVMTEADKLATDKDENREAGGDLAAKDKQASAGEELEEDKLLKALPQLEPAAGGAVSLLKSMKMRVLEEFENGDLLLGYERSAMDKEEAHAMVIEARLPREHIFSPDGVTTAHLTNVHIIDHSQDEIVDKRSTNWEDEYSLRVSGFNEIKSKAAAELDEKREAVASVRDRMQERLKAMSAERRQWAGERDKWLQDIKQNKDKIAEQEAKLQEFDKLIQEQKKQLEDVRKAEEKVAASDKKSEASD